MKNKIASFVLIILALGFLPAAFASAQNSTSVQDTTITVQQLQEQIKYLQKQITELQKELANTKGGSKPQRKKLNCSQEHCKKARLAMI